MSKINTTIINKEDKMDICEILGMLAVVFQSSLGRVTKRTPYNGFAFNDKEKLSVYIDTLIKVYNTQYGENVPLSKHAIGLIKLSDSEWVKAKNIKVDDSVTHRDKTEYLLTMDEDCHWYVIPADKLEEWEEWIESTDAEDGVIPDWAVEVGGSPASVSFTGYSLWGI